MWVEILNEKGACSGFKSERSDLQHDIIEGQKKKQGDKQHDEKDLNEFVAKMHKDIEDFWKRKIIKTEQYHDSEIDEDVTKNTYEDGSWSTEWRRGKSYEYNEYYPNSKILKFCSSRDYLPFWQSSWGYTICDEQGKILFADWFWGPESFDWAEAMDKYDNKGRIIYREYDTAYTYKYDDENGKVTCIKEIFGGEWVSVYEMDEYGLANENKILSKSFIGETGREIDVLNGWVAKLIEDMHLQDVPYIDSYY